jgi:hypothetical protein
MSLEANKFLYDKINKQAVENEMNVHNDIVRKIKRAQLKEKQEIEAEEPISQKEYNFFLKKANDFAFSLFQIIDSINNENFEDKEGLMISDLIKNYNELVITLSRIKYKSLNTNDKQKIYNRIKEFLPNLNLISNTLNMLAIPPNENKFLNYKLKIDQIIRQINENLFDQVSFPLVD